MILGILSSGCQLTCAPVLLCPADTLFSPPIPVTLTLFLSSSDFWCCEGCVCEMSQLLLKILHLFILWTLASGASLS